jgi:serine/threonine protein kinase
MSSPTDRNADANLDGSLPLSDHSAALAATRPHSGTSADAAALDATRPHAGTAADAAALAQTRPHAGLPAAAPRPIDALIGQKVRAYRIVRELGRGGMGVVYEAVHDEIGQRAAVKTLNLQRLAGSANDPAIAQRFLTEAKALAIARHPGLVNIFDYGQLEGGTLFLLMEFLEGESLASRMERRPTDSQDAPTAGRTPGMRSQQAVRLARQISDALAVTHGKGIYHRDLKPSNIHIVADSEAPGGERVKILDFGLARIRPAEEAPDGDGKPGPQLARTSTSVVMGTPIYMAPEQCRGLAQADGPSDVYSLGVMLYELLAGTPPFTGNTASDLIAMHIYQPPPPLAGRVPGLSRALSSLVMSMLRKEPAERPTMAEVAQTLREIERQPAVPASAAASNPRRMIVLLCSALALLVLLWLLVAPPRSRGVSPAPRLGDSPPAIAPSVPMPTSAVPAPTRGPTAGTVAPSPAPTEVAPTAVPAPPAPSAAQAQAQAQAQAPPEKALGPSGPAPERRPARPLAERPARRGADKGAKPGTDPAKNPGMAPPSPTDKPPATASPPTVPKEKEKEKEDEVHVPALR